MPANPRSLRITDAYRTRVFAIRDSLERWAQAQWPTIDRLDSTNWPARMATVLTHAQKEAIRATGGYLVAFLAAELGRRVASPVLDTKAAGLSRDGRPLAEALQSPIVGVLGALKDGKAPEDALAVGLVRAKRMVGVDFDQAHRASLLDAIAADGRFEGWQRAVRGTCGACAGVATGLSSAPTFQVHPGCQCVSEPVVSGVGNAAPRLTGAQIFAAKSKDEQNEMLGAHVAERVRAGEVTLADLVGRSHLDSDQDDFLTQATV